MGIIYIVGDSKFTSHTLWHAWSVRTIFGLTLNFEITEYEENKSWDWDVLGLPITSHRVEAPSPEKTTVIFDLPYVLFPYSIVCLFALRRIAQIAIRLR